MTWAVAKLEMQVLSRALAAHVETIETVEDPQPHLAGNFGFGCSTGLIGLADGLADPAQVS